jgi:similar to spore coat protein
LIKEKIAPHETFELHEILMFKNVCATKSAVMVKLVADEELKSLLQQDLMTSKEQIEELKGLIQSSELWDLELAPGKH